MASSSGPLPPQAGPIPLLVCICTLPEYGVFCGAFVGEICMRCGGCIAVEEDDDEDDEDEEDDDDDVVVVVMMEVV